MNEFLIALGGAFFGAVFGAWASAQYMFWDRRETAKDNLIMVVTKMGVHLHQCKGIEGNRTEPWTVYMEEALAAFYQFRSTEYFWRIDSLDRAWAAFQGVSPNSAGEDRFAYVSLMDISIGCKRITTFLDAIRGVTKAK